MGRSKKNCDWVDFAGVCDFTGQTENDFYQQPIPYQIVDIIAYYGADRILSDTGQTLSYAQVLRQVR